MELLSTPTELTSSVLNKVVGRYYKELKDYESKGNTELNLRPAFQNLLAEMARRVNLTLVHEMTIRGRIRPDGVLLNSFSVRRGYWEARNPRAIWKWRSSRRNAMAIPSITPCLRILGTRFSSREANATTSTCKPR